MTRTVRTLLLCAVAALVCPGSGHAQIKNLLKKKAAAQVTGEQKADDGRGPKAPQFGGAIVELTEPVLADFMMAHALENRLIREFRQQLGRLKPGDEHSECEQNVKASPEAQQLMIQQLGAAGENPTSADIQRIMEKVERDVKAMVKSKCGESIDVVWPHAKRSQQMAHFRRLASLAFDSALDARVAPRPRGGPVVAEPSWLQEPSPRYPMSDERTLAFCRLKDANKLTRDERGFWFGYSSPNVPWLFTDDEYDALSKKCKQLEHEEEAG